MTSKRFNKLPENTREINPESIEKLLPIIKKIVLQNLMRVLI